MLAMPTCKLKIKSKLILFINRLIIILSKVLIFVYRVPWDIQLMILGLNVLNVKMDFTHHI